MASIITFVHRPRQRHPSAVYEKVNPPPGCRSSDSDPRRSFDHPESSTADTFQQDSQSRTPAGVWPAGVRLSGTAGRSPPNDTDGLYAISSTSVRRKPSSGGG